MSLNDYSIIPFTLVHRYKLIKSPFDIYLSDIHIEKEREGVDIVIIFVSS